MFQFTVFAGLLFIGAGAFAHGGSGQYFIELKAMTKFERSAIANLGFAIEELHKDYVVVSGDAEDVHTFQNKGLLLGTSQKAVSTFSFPPEDSGFHDHHEIMAVMDEMQERHPELVKIKPIGMSVEGRIIPMAIATMNPETHSEKPGIAFTGAHHAREHLSAEVPLRHFLRFCELYEKGDEQVVRLLKTRSLYFIPLINPDGKVFDLDGDRYRAWRKNRKLFGSTYGVDLNRNYSFEWGTGGSSTNPTSDVYMGPEPFSEPETRAVRDFFLRTTNLTSLLDYHAYGKMILYPWGHTYDSIEQQNDLQIHQTMAEQMANWNGYRPMQASDLYTASGVTIDWTYGELGLISFTFEVDPTGWGRGGFYPGDEIIEQVVEKNWRPAIYMTEYADDPSRVLTEVAAD